MFREIIEAGHRVCAYCFRILLGESERDQIVDAANKLSDDLDPIYIISVHFNSFYIPIDHCLCQVCENERTMFDWQRRPDVIPQDWNELAGHRRAVFLRFYKSLLPRTKAIIKSLGVSYSGDAQRSFLEESSLASLRGAAGRRR